MSITPVITIFVRHSPGCKYAGDEFAKQCRCRKHLRWSLAGRQHRKKAGTRSWSEAEDVKRRLESQLRGDPIKVEDDAVSIRAALDSFIKNKEGQNISTDVVERNRRELGRLADFAENNGCFTVRALSLALLIEYRATWPKLYPSSSTRSLVLKRLRGFLRFCVDNGWLDRAPTLAPVKVDEPPTMPLTPAEYESLLAAVSLEFPNGLGKRLRAAIQLMRWTGLSVRDAVTLRRDQLLCSAKKTYHVVTARQKTGTHVSVPIPTDVAEEVLAACDHNVYLLWQNTKDGTEKQAGHSASIAITKVFERAGIKTLGHMKSHRLRDTFACELLQQGVPLEDVSKMLGHNSIATTEKHYSAWVKSRQDRLDSLVTGTWKKK
jgi:integrase/recombinase XerD